MKNWIFYIFVAGLFTFASCNNNKSEKSDVALAEVVNTDTVTLSCDANHGIVTLVFLGEQGNYDRVTAFIDSNYVELLADTAINGKRFTASNKSMSLLTWQDSYTFYKDTVMLFSCKGALAGREFTSTSGVVYVVEETKGSGASLSNLRITSRGLAESETDMSLTDIDPVKDIFLADINNDGFDELYVITEVAGSGGYAGIIGIASNNNKSTSSITVPELTEEDMKAGNIFEGYQGHDKIYIENKQLVREFPIYKAGDNNATPSGGSRKVIYTLSKGEASWILTATPAK